MSKKNDIVKKIKINKNILSVVAVVLALAIVATIVVVAIRNDREIYVDQDGIEHWLVTDSEGNTRLANNGDLMVYATDIKGKLMTDEDGNPEYRYVDFPEILIKDNTLETPYYKITMPENWTLAENGTYHYKDNEEITFDIAVLSVYSGTIDEYMKENEETKLEILEALKAIYGEIEENNGNAEITLRKIYAQTAEYTVEKDGKNELYTKAYYFAFNSRVFKVNLYCPNGSYTDEIDVESLINSNLVMKGYATD